MEYKKNTIRNQPNSSGTSHFTESNAGHISVKTTSPFLNKKRDSEFTVTVTESDHNKSKTTSGSVLNKKLPKEIASGTSKMLINQILGDSNVDKNATINKSLNETSLSLVDQTCKYDEKITLSNVEYKYSVPTINSKSFSMRLGSCSGEDSIAPSTTSPVDEKCKDLSQSNNTSSSKIINRNKQYAEKTTYCRLARNHNSEYFYKTVETNNKLQRLVKKLIDIRKKEKQTEAWNNYVNELKNRHGYGDSEQNGLVGRYTIEESAPLEYIDDYYNTKFTSKRSNECKELLNEFYDSYNIVTPDRPEYQIHYRHQKSSCYNYKASLNSTNCYPMSSQGRFKMLNRERNKNSYGNECFLQQLPTSRPFYRNTIFVDKEPTRLRSSCCKVQARKIEKTVLNKKCTCSSFPSQVISTSIQTEHNVEPLGSVHGQDIKNTAEEHTQKDHVQEETFKESYCRVSENVERLKKRLQETCNADTCRMQKNVLQSIESKLDSLLNSINSFMNEVKSKTQVDKCLDSQEVSLNPINSKHLSNITMPISRSDPLGLIKAERIVCGCGTQEPSISIMSENREACDNTVTTNVNRCLIEDMDMRNNFNSMFSGNVVNCAVQISVDIPTKERSTEVTNSLSNTVLKLEDKTISIEEIERNPSDGEKTITIAVNTDPLGLLALLRFSTEAVKQLLSYMPNIPYYQYLSMINFPHRTEDTHYVCNICGAAFVRPSQLSDHIRLHDLGQSRDCCVCRHVLDMQRRRPSGLFRCRHCGQRFTRAYCCELHQESCARRLGVRPEVTPSLILLR